MNYKTLIKNIEKKTAVPILAHICVTDDSVMTTDMDNHLVIEGAQGIENGIYMPHGFDKGIYLKSPLKVEDFPIPQSGGKIIGKTSLSKIQFDSFKWVMKASSTEKVRYYLNGVYFDPNGFVIATDGHRLHSFKHEVIDLNQNKDKKSEPQEKRTFDGAILPNKACKLIVSMMEETKADFVQIFFFDNLKFSAVVGGILLHGKLIDGTYPNWRRVLPTEIKGTTVIDNQELCIIKEKLNVYHKAGYSKIMSVSIREGTIGLSNGDYKDQRFPVKITAPFEFGFNMKYLFEAGGGILSYIDSSSPFLIEERRGMVDRTAALMPLRV